VKTRNFRAFARFWKLPNVIRLRNERVDRNSGRRLVEHAPDEARVAGTQLRRAGVSRRTPERCRQRFR